MKYHIYLLFIIIVIIIIFFIDISINYKINGKSFRLRPSIFGSLREKAEVLYELQTKLDKLVEHLIANDIPNKESANRLASRFKNTELRETGIFEFNTAYTLNKGKEIRICLDRGGKDKLDVNLIMFVLLHEMAHVMSETYGHNREFIENMDIIVKTAVKIGIYMPTDFSAFPGRYCGSNITSSPCNNGMCRI